MGQLFSAQKKTTGSGFIGVARQNRAVEEGRLAQQVIGNNAGAYKVRTNNTALNLYQQLQKLPHILINTRGGGNTTTLTYKYSGLSRSDRRSLNLILAQLTSLNSNNIRKGSRRKLKGYDVINITVSNKLHRAKPNKKPNTTAVSVFAMNPSDGARTHRVKRLLNAEVRAMVKGKPSAEKWLKELSNSTAPDKAVDYLAAKINAAKARL